LATNKTLGYDMPRMSLYVLLVFGLFPVGRIDHEFKETHTHAHKHKPVGLLACAAAKL